MHVRFLEPCEHKNPPKDEALHLLEPEVPTLLIAPMLIGDKSLRYTVSDDIHTKYKSIFLRRSQFEVFREPWLFNACRYIKILKDDKRDQFWDVCTGLSAKRVADGLDLSLKRSSKKVTWHDIRDVAIGSRRVICVFQDVGIGVANLRRLLDQFRSVSPEVGYCMQLLGRLALIYFSADNSRIEQIHCKLASTYSSQSLAIAFRNRC